MLEIGTGTGQVTVPLARRGLAVTGVELGPALAALCRQRLAGYPSCEVVVSAFEDWQPDGEPFGAVVAVNCLHWIDPQVQYAKPAALLRSGSAMVVGGCRWARPADAGRFWTDVQEDYRAVGFEGEPPPPPAEITGWHFPLDALEFFTETASLRYPFEWTYSADDYLAQLATQAGTRALGADGAADFLARVRHRLESLGSPRLSTTFVGQLTVGIRR